MPADKGYFALRLKELRTQGGMSQIELADQADLALGTIRQLEQGRSEPTYETLVKLVAGLGVSLAAFDQPTGLRNTVVRRARKPSRPLRKKK